MTLLQRQSYNLWFNHIADKVIEWRDAKPANKDLRNFVKGMSEVGQYVNQLHIENDVLLKRVSLIRSQKNTMITDLQKQIEELQDQLKQFDI
jgi:hypothetical protein